MPPNKRKKIPGEAPTKVKRVTKVDLEKLICKKKLDALDREESQTKEDRFSSAERRILLDAYNENGYNVFQDTKLLHRYLPNRQESDLKGLVQRLKSSLISNKLEGNSSSKQYIDDWQVLCQQLMGNYAKDRKVNLDDVISDALMIVAEEKDLDSAKSSINSIETNDLNPDYPKLWKSFAQLLMGKFPESMSPNNARLSMKLFNHINSMVDSTDLSSAFSALESGEWLESTLVQRHQRQEMAMIGLNEIDGITKKCPTYLDFETSRNIEALCLELPKIKRITDVLNPLNINESLVSSLMKLFNGTST